MTSTGLSKWRSGRGEIDGSKENYTRATNQGAKEDVRSHREQIDSK
jgi:hypothetical protein